MFKIGEFSRLTQVSVRMLRYYDKNNLLKPEKIDQFTGYRYYSSGQIRDLHKIIFLRDLGYSTVEILNAIKNWNSSFMRKQMENKKLEIFCRRFCFEEFLYKFIILLSTKIFF